MDNKMLPFSGVNVYFIKEIFLEKISKVQIQSSVLALEYKYIEKVELIDLVVTGSYK